MLQDTAGRDYVRDTIRRAMSAPILSIEREKELERNIAEFAERKEVVLSCPDMY